MGFIHIHCVYFYIDFIKSKLIFDTDIISTADTFYKYVYNISNFIVAFVSAFYYSIFVILSIFSPLINELNSIFRYHEDSKFPDFNMNIIEKQYVLIKIPFLVDLKFHKKMIIYFNYIFNMVIGISFILLLSALISYFNLNFSENKLTSNDLMILLAAAHTFIILPLTSSKKNLFKDIAQHFKKS
jgi:hypothetical protein